MGGRSDGLDRYRDLRLDIDNMSYEVCCNNWGGCRMKLDIDTCVPVILSSWVWALLNRTCWSSVTGLGM